MLLLRKLLGLDLNKDFRKAMDDNATDTENAVNNLQTQLDTLVVEGDSSPAANQARVDADGVTHPSLKARIDAEQNKIGILSTLKSFTKNSIVNALNELWDKLTALQLKNKSVIDLDSYVDLVPNKNVMASEAEWDWSDAIQALNNDVLASEKATTIKVTGYKKFYKSVRLNVAYASFDFTDSEIDISEINDGSAGIIFEGGNLTYNNLSYQNMRTVKSLFVRGAGKTSNSKGIAFNSPTGSIQGVSFWGLEVKEVGTGLSFEQNAYLLSFFNPSIGRCGVGVHMPAGFTNYGENIAFYGGVIANNDLCIKNENNNGNFHLNGTSVDYSAKIADIQGGGVFFNHSHVEHNNQYSPPMSGPPITLGTDDSCKFIMTGGFLMFWNVPNVDYIFDTQNTRQAGGIILNSVTFFNVKSNTGILCSGTGLLEINDPLLYEGNGNMSISPITSRANNKLVDGGFNEPSIIDVYVSSDTAAITNRTTGANVTLEVDATTKYEGTSSMKVSKINGAGSNAGFSILVPVDRGRHHAYKFKINKGTIASGKMYVTDHYGAYYGFDSNMLPVASKVNPAKSTREIDFGTIASGWVEVTCPVALSKAPKWATHYRIAFNGFSISSGAFNIDDFIVTSL